jgi:clan AA aspartic protease
VIQGSVSPSREAWIRLSVRGPGGIEVVIDAVIDTGFTGTLTLPPGTISVLGLRSQGQERGQLADGSEALFPVYEAAVLWEGQPRNVPLYEADAVPLVGMSLLYGSELRIQVTDGGDVSITPLTP